MTNHHVFNCEVKKVHSGVMSLSLAEALYHGLSAEPLKFFNTCISCAGM
jgi:hypothetical protein